MSYFKPRNFLLVLALVLALVLLTVIVMKRRPESRVQTLVKALPKGVDVALQDIDYTHVEDGLARWRMVAQQVEHQSESASFTIKKPFFTYYDQAGNEVGIIQADKGIVDNNYKKVRLLEDVVLKDSKGYELYSDLLDYDNNLHIVTTNTDVRLVGNGMSLEGTGLYFKIEKKRLRLDSNVKGFLEP